MRLAGKFDDQHDAATFVDYLLTLGIAAKAERAGEAWDLWILDEERVADGKRELAEFRANPQDEMYRAAAKQAEQIRQDQVEKALSARRNVVNLPRSSGTLIAKRRPVTMMLLVASAVVFTITDFGQKHAVMDKLMMSEVVGTALPEVRRGELWRLLTPMLVHLFILHFAFNMVWLVKLGTQIETRSNSLLFAVLVVCCDLATNFSQLYWKDAFFGGMSGVNYGLFGFIWVRMTFEPWQGYRVSQSDVVVLMIWLFACMTGAVGPVANAGHVGGLIAGSVFGYVPTLVRRLRGKN
jgi:GlpG protein